MADEKRAGNSPPDYGKTFSVSEKPQEGYTEQTVRRKSSAVDPEILTGEIYDERFESTKRGLKSRHAQMIALGVLPRAIPKATKF
jgi:amino acid transporter